MESGSLHRGHRRTGESFYRGSAQSDIVIRMSALKKFTQVTIRVDHAHVGNDGGSL